MTFPKNELSKESSPYLLQHANNPVQWHAWNSTNIENAKKLGLPLLISVGYASCHWCHVMEHESFMDEEVADIMNRYFYCIKVDREERPDVDQVYMTAANIITGKGGWPLNCFALADGRPFHAGTYYPKAQWLNLLENVHHQFIHKHEQIVSYAERLTAGIRIQETAITDALSSQIKRESIVQMVELWKHKWDMKWGGTVGAPKFPMPVNFDFLIAYLHYNDDAQAEDFVTTSLIKIASGGLYDQLGGGFARYAVDDRWKIPHFEKMLYDNAQLLEVYSEEFKRSQNPLFKVIIDETIEWLQTEMLDSSGLYQSAIDADSEGSEGRYYVWTKEELQAVLKDDFEFARDYFSIDESGYWEHDQYILLRWNSIKAISEKHNISTEEVQNKAAAIKVKLLNARVKRQAPSKDNKCLCSWNGMLLSGLCKSYNATGNLEYLKHSAKLADAMINTFVHEHEVLHSAVNASASITGLLEDYAFAAKGLLDLYSSSGEEYYYHKSLTIYNLAIQYFYNSNKGIYHFNLKNELIVQTAELYDNVTPSTNAVMVNLNILFGLLEARTDWLSIGQGLLEKVQQHMTEYPVGHSYWAKSHLMLSYPFYEVAVIGNMADEFASELKKQHLPQCFIVHSTEASNMAIFKNRFVDGKTLIYVCQHGSCSLPKENISDVLDEVRLKSGNQLS